MHSEFMDMKLSDPVVNADLGDEHVESFFEQTRREGVADCKRAFSKMMGFYSSEQRSDESYEQYRERIGVQ